MFRTVLAGGVGVAVSAEDVARVAQGSQVAVDTVAYERLKRDAPKASADERRLGSKELRRTTDDCSSVLPGNQSRATTFVRLLTIVNGGKTGVRPVVVDWLTIVLNSGRSLRLPASDSELEIAQAVDEAFCGPPALLENDEPHANSNLSSESADASAYPSLTDGERRLLQSGQSGTAGVGSLCVAFGRTCLSTTTSVAALTCEGIKANLRALEGEGEGPASKAVVEVTSQLLGLLEGSKQINPRKGAALEAVLALPQYHALMEEALTAANAALRNYLATPVTVSDKGEVSAPYSPALPSSQLRLAQALLPVAGLSLKRTAALLHQLGQQGSGVEGAGQLPASLMEGLQAAADACAAKLSAARKQVAEASGRLVADDGQLGVSSALVAMEALDALEAAVALEGLGALLCVRLAEGPVGAPQAQVNGNVGAPAGGKDKGGKGKKGGGGGFALGRGTQLLRGYLAAPLPADTPVADSADWVGSMLRGGVAVSAVLPLLAQRLSSQQELIGPQLLLLRQCVEANQARRKPKIPKGTRDLLPEQMTIRELALGLISDVFKRHGAVSIDTPVFELRETLTGKYGEDSKLIYDLADQGGEILSLRYDLTVPFARYVALHGIGNIKRYHIGKVYRRDQPNMNRGRFREFYQCDFDIAGSYPTMVPDAEILAVLVEILRRLPVGEFEVKLNHRRLLDAMLDIAGVPAQKFRPICSAIDKLDKEPWETVRAEMVDEKGLAPEMADKIGQFVVLRGHPQQLLTQLQDPAHPFSQHPDSKVALEELSLLFGFMATMGVLPEVVFDLSLARGLDYYTGVIYEAVLKGGNVGSIAGGGRYDRLVGMFSGKDIPAVGVSVGIERVFSIMEANMRQQAQDTNGFIRETETQVLVSSIGSGLQQRRMELCARLWEAGVKAEFGYKANPKMGDQLGYALKAGIPLMVLFGEDELARGEVKVKNLPAQTERLVSAASLVEEVKKELATVSDERVVSWGSAQQQSV